MEATSVEAPLRKNLRADFSFYANFVARKSPCLAEQKAREFFNRSPLRLDSVFGSLFVYFSVEKNAFDV